MKVLLFRVKEEGNDPVEVLRALDCVDISDTDLSLYEVIAFGQLDTTSVDEAIDYVNENIEQMRFSDILEIEPDVGEKIEYDGEIISYPLSFLIYNSTGEYELLSLSYDTKQFNEYLSKLNIVIE